MRLSPHDAPAEIARMEAAAERKAAEARAASGTWTLDDMRLLSDGPRPKPPTRHEMRRYAALSRRSQTR